MSISWFFTTCFRANKSNYMTSSSQIDVILNTTPSSHVQTGVIKITLSDHYMSYTVLSNSTPRLPDKRITIRDFKHFSEHTFLYDVRQKFLDFTTQCKTSLTTEDVDIDFIWNSWKVKFDKSCTF